LGGETTYPDPEPFDCLSEIELSGTSTWSDILDGQGAVTIGYTEFLMSEGHYVEHSTVVLDSATLVVDGAIVAEPATVFLLAFGTVIARTNKRNKSRQYR
jgi:hypothetical protein